jgi:hypothetical protein
LHTRLTRQGQHQVILIAFALVQTATGPKLYAAVRNDGDAPACEAGMTTYFFDKANQDMTESGSVLQSGHLSASLPK